MDKIAEFLTRRTIQIQLSELNWLNEKERIKPNNPNIVEKVKLYNWRNSVYTSGCYIKKWYHFSPKLRLLVTENNITTTITESEYNCLREKVFDKI